MATLQDAFVLIKQRGEITPSHGSILTQIANGVGCTNERALEIIRELEGEGSIVIERDETRSGGPVVKVRLA